jgi:GH24 family phage-related lysozyme (muramidase)
MTVKEKEYNNFRKWIEANKFIAYKDKYYTSTSVYGWTLKQLRKIYKEEKNNLNCI